MKVFQFKYLLCLLLLLPEVLYCQPKITVTKPRLEVTDDNLHISYDILNSKSSEFFIVWIEVTDSKGNKINAVTVTGDVGDNVVGGKNKRITWNFISDSIFIDENLFVEVKVEKVPVEEEIVEAVNTEKTKTEDTKTVNEPNENKLTEKQETTENKELPGDTKQSELKEETVPPAGVQSSKKDISKVKMALTSAVLPGWGQTKASKGKPFWLIGAAGYGCIAGSVILNRSASSAYDNYKSSMDPDESNTLFDKAASRNSISKVLGYSAIGIWAADLIWVLATPVRNTQTSFKQNERKLRISPGFDTSTNSGIVLLTYNF